MNAPIDGWDGLSDAGSAAFERRAAQLLRDSAERLPAQTRSRLTRARFSALEAPHSRPRELARRWSPAGAGALAAAALAVLLTVPAHREVSGGAILAAATPEDLEMLSDADALPLGHDQDVDYEFYEWAVGEASGGDGPAAGT